MNEPAKKTCSLHGVFLDVLGVGILLTGLAGIGKSEVALGLVNRGHALVADDAVLLELQDDNSIIGHCPEVLQDFLEVRGLGILNIKQMYGDQAVKLQKTLDLIVNLIHINPEEMHHIDRLHGMHRTIKVLDQELLEVSIPVAPGRHLAVLVEAAVRLQLLRNSGYDASNEFIKRQQALIGNGQ